MHMLQSMYTQCSNYLPVQVHALALSWLNSKFCGAREKVCRSCCGVVDSHSAPGCEEERKGSHQEAVCGNAKDIQHFDAALSKHTDGIHCRSRTHMPVPQSLSPVLLF